MARQKNTQMYRKETFVLAYMYLCFCTDTRVQKWKVMLILVPSA